jgi:pimeloyl-ACP methyl ester carboxylesterase
MGLATALCRRFHLVKLYHPGSFGESTTRPRGILSPVDDVLDTLAEVGIDRSHLVGASFGAAVAVEAALTRPQLVASLLLSPRVDHSSQSSRRTCASSSRPRTPRWRARGDLGDAVEANLAWWVDGPRRQAGDVEPTVRELV